MDTPQPIAPPSIRVHKRQRTWQILVPFLVFAGLILVLAGLFASGAISTTSTWADVSIVWLIVPMLFFALFFLVVLVFLIYGISKLLQVMPRYTGKTQDFFTSLSGWTRKIADGIANPVVRLNQAGAVIKSFFNKS
jgi:predicted PurR-regulated permease PerM